MLDKLKQIISRIESNKQQTIGTLNNEVISATETQSLLNKALNISTKIKSLLPPDTLDIRDTDAIADFFNSCIDLEATTTDNIVLLPTTSDNVLTVINEQNFFKFSKKPTKYKYNQKSYN